MRTLPSGRSSTRGVLPTSSRRFGATRVSATGHRRQQDHRRSRSDLGVDPVARAYVLALDVDVHERGQAPVLHELRAERWKAARQVVEQLTHGLAFRGDLALAAD